MPALKSLLGLLVVLAVSACGGGSSGARLGPPTSGLYASAQYTDAQLVPHLDLVYSVRPNEGGVQYTSDLRSASEIGGSTLNLHLDVWVPPDATAAKPQPLVVWIHGGDFLAGSKEEVRDKALSYARAGYVVASVDYRLTPRNTTSAALRERAVLQAVDQLRPGRLRRAAEDVTNAIRYLRQNADVYHIDTTRVATVGTSAGGALSLAVALDADTLPGLVSDYPGQSARSQASVSTGATVFDAYYDSSSALSFDATDAPVLLLHANPTDSFTGATWSANVIPTRDRITTSGNTCELVAQPNLTHVVDLSLGGKYWDSVGPFLWTKLDLASLL